MWGSVGGEQFRQVGARGVAKRPLGSEAWAPGQWSLRRPDSGPWETRLGKAGEESGSRGHGVGCRI